MCAYWLHAQELVDLGLQRGGIVVLRGNLAPQGAVLKPSAATPELMQHRGRAVVFEDIEDYKARVDDPGLDVDETCGITDMLRISDARMSGTAYGTVVLHTAPEAAAGGPLALVRNGDAITLDVAERQLTLEVSEEELARGLVAEGR